MNWADSPSLKAQGGTIPGGSGHFFQRNGVILAGSGRFLVGNGVILAGSGRFFEGNGVILAGWDHFFERNGVIFVIRVAADRLAFRVLKLSHATALLLSHS